MADATARDVIVALRKPAPADDSPGMTILVFRWDDPNLEIKLLGRNVRPADLAMIMGHKGEKVTVFARPDFFGETYLLDFEGNGGARAGNAGEGSVSQPRPSAPDAMKMGSPENGQES